MLMCSVGQKFGKGTRTPCLCHTKSVSLFERTGRLKATQWLKTETTSLTCLVVNTAFQLRSQFLNWAVGLLLGSSSNEADLPQNLDCNSQTMENQYSVA